MVKISRNFRLSDKDIELLDDLVEYFSYLHGTKHNRTTVLTLLIRIAHSFVFGILKNKKKKAPPTKM